jgi:hypothetical protein
MYFCLFQVSNQHLKTFLFEFFSKTSLLNVKLLIQNVCTFLGDVRRTENKPLCQENAERKYFQPKWLDMKNILICHLHIQGGAKRTHVFEMGSIWLRFLSLGLPQIKSLRSKTSYSRRFEIFHSRRNCNCATRNVSKCDAELWGEVPDVCVYGKDAIFSI